MTEEKMLSRLKRGKTDALEALIHQYNSYVCAIVTYVLGGRATAQDVDTSPVCDVVNEEAASYFAGDITAETAAAHI